MDIQAEKISLIQLLLNTDDVTIIKKVKAIFNTNKKDFWLELTQEQRDEIEEADREIDRGEYVDFYEFIKEHQSAKSNSLKSS